MYYLSKKSKKNREGVDPRLIEISDLAITITLVDFGHGNDAGLRTAERQNELFKGGKSKADGFKKKGSHQSGKALDFYAYTPSLKATWNKQHLAMVACAFLQAASTLGYRIKWGGLWSSDKNTKSQEYIYGWDMPHVEILD